MTHAAFYGIGAYAVAILSTTYHLNFFVAMLIGIMVATLTALALGVVLGKFRDDYYALVSFGFNIIAYSIFINWTNLTRGPLGIPGIRRPEIFDWVLRSNFYFLILCVLLVALVYFIVNRVTRCPFGRALKAIREDEEALSVFGYNTARFKMISFALSAGLASIAGALLASYITFIDPSTFTLNESIFILAIVIMGGLADLRGSILGAVILVILPEALRFLGLPENQAANLRLAFYGLVLIILMFVRPQGLLGKYKM
ncbi:MAG: hypothetical protein A3J93_05435 [Candidatus Magasanikbacteria bacterium RIFOXYC2_FULL_42_28]|uniref:Branched-chain amino acid ABC transporter permease n=1 Tax=Candidatus Magasanikbacteria bacterium RIFOXYC2_FULL_42_28 TaxID=1798704 RepID=A0A1F6NV84_9BACT|nr:MAG: hypothetical protein A3J93_05435 [Candidatus Magasanikbacteria bacterium RIFOXYC2_FULL_42_28]